MNPEEQSEHDRAEIKIKLIDNGVLVKAGASWFAFDTWEKASANIAGRISALKRKRKEAGNGAL